jgi:amidase
MSIDENLIRLTARQAVDLLRASEVSPLELVEAALARHEAVDGSVNAMPTLCAERARDQARRIIDRGTPSHEGVEAAGVWLGGLPIAVKDL